MQTETSHNGDGLLQIDPTNQSQAMLSEAEANSLRDSGPTQNPLSSTRRNQSQATSFNPIFDGKALELARRVNEEAAVKLAKFKALQEEILRPKHARFSYTG